jgi:hypothetical protein
VVQLSDFVEYIVTSRSFAQKQLISYVIVVNWFFFQITVAVLLEICQEASRDEEKKKQADQVAQKQREKALRNPLDPLLLELSQEFVSEEDLDVLLNNLFTVCRLALPRGRPTTA